MLRKFFNPPVFEDEEKTRIARLLHTIILIQALIPGLLLINVIRLSANPTILASIFLFLTIPLMAIYVYMQRGYIRAVSIALIIYLSIIALLFGYINGGQPRPYILYYPFIIVIAGLLLGGYSAIISALVSSVLLGFVTYSGSIGFFPELIPAPKAGLSIVTYTIALILIGIVLRLASNSIGLALERAGNSERDLTKSNLELQELSASLEGHITDRTDELATRSVDLELANKQIQRRAAQFEALAQVTQTITSIRDLRELLPRITTVISEKFGFYHVGIFLLDDISAFAVLSAANSAGGSVMLDRKHRLRVGEEGIVGYAAATGKPRVAMDVGVDAVFFNNPDLPGTHSEMALPLISKNVIVGVLDVQSTEMAAFTSEDIQMLSLLADQVSLAIENARLFDESRRALAESEMIGRRTTREAWSRLPEQQKLLGYRYSVAGASPLRELLKLGESGTDRHKDKQAKSSQTVVPIELRGETIGNLVVQSPVGNKWNQDQLDLIKAVAERVALSAENARLFDETTARAEREKLVSDISSKIRSHTDPQSMIETAINELRSALGASRVEVIPQSVKGAEKNEA